MGWKLAMSVLAVSLVAASARADDATCAASYETRLTATKAAAAKRIDYIDKNHAKFAAAAWFGEHCRFLSELERAVRKLDDPAAFVCDPKAPGRPKGLSAELVYEFGSQPSLDQFLSDDAAQANLQCLETDRAHRLALAWPEAGITRLDTLELLCYGDERAQCVHARATVAEVRAKR